MLFPTEGQVTHALLTRPPLSFKESKLPFGFVRLACVKHAASVHPEPGSNSQKKLLRAMFGSITLLNSILRIEKVRYYFKFLHSIQFSRCAPRRCRQAFLHCLSAKCLIILIRSYISVKDFFHRKWKNFPFIINKQYYQLEIRGSQPSVCLSAASDRAMLRCSTRMPSGTSGLADEKLRIFEMPAATAASQTSWQA